MNSFEYLHRKLNKCLHIYLAQTERCGLGIFAAKPIRAGAIVLADEDGDYYRNVVSYRELCGRGYRLDITLQVGHDAYKLPNCTLDDFTNHSCEPNTGIRLTARGMLILALRDIAAHEELTYDYSTYLNNPVRKHALPVRRRQLPRRDRQLQHLAGRAPTPLPRPRRGRRLRRGAVRAAGGRRLAMQRLRLA